MSVPKDVKSTMQARLWQAADDLEWNSLGSAEKSRHYKQWTDSEIGRTLANHMDARSVRVYIKDTLLKDYARAKLKGQEDVVLRVLGRARTDIAESFIKPHGFRFEDGGLVAWGWADDWKSLLGSLFERSFEADAPELVALLFRTAPRYVSASQRAMVEVAAERLGVKRTVWFD